MQCSFKKRHPRHELIRTTIVGVTVRNYCPPVPCQGRANNGLVMNMKEKPQNIFKKFWEAL